jgi:hypothetical protein
MYGIMAVTDLAPYFFIQETANNNSIMPSLMFLFSKDFIIKMFWSRTGYNSCMFISPSLNREFMLLPKVMSRCEVTSFAKISASNAKILKLKDWRG